MHFGLLVCLSVCLSALITEIILLKLTFEENNFALEKEYTLYDDRHLVLDLYAETSKVHYGEKHAQ